ncbi:MAG: signal peptidase II [Gemmatimonadaceae bacterium]
MIDRGANGALYWPIAAGIVVVDALTKRIATAALVPRHIPHAVVGDWVRLTLAYNRGAAFGLQVGAYSRWVFMALTGVVLAVLHRLYRQTPEGDVWRVVGLSLVTAGAVGNLLDRVLSTDGVVDFIDIGLGATRFWTFNVADIAVSAGTGILLWVMVQRQPRSPARA